MIADKNTAHSYMVPFSGYVAMSVYAMYVPCSRYHCVLSDMMRHMCSGMVIDQARKGGFRFRTMDEFAVNQEKERTADAESVSDSDRISPSVDKKAEEFVEVVQ